MCTHGREAAQRVADSLRVYATVVRAPSATGRFAYLFEKPVTNKHTEVGKPGGMTGLLLQFI
jgi:hypothetical protein